MHVCKNLRVLLKCHERAQSDTSVVLEDSRNNARKHFESIFACVQEHETLHAQYINVDVTGCQEMELGALHT